MYAGECNKPEMGKFRVCNILCIWVVGANCKLEMGNFRFATFCVYVCLFIANFKLEMGNLGFATFYVYGWWVQTANLKWETSDLQHFVCVCVFVHCQLQT
jgi:hypothetical protein